MAKHPWHEATPPGDTSPKGDPACLDDTLEALGIGAEERETARESLWQIAASFNGLSSIDGAAPRSKAVREQLQRVEDLAGELARALDGLDQYAAEALWSGPPGAEPPWVTIDPKGNLRDRLEAPSATANRTAGHYPDKGGTALPWRQRWGHPKAKLAGRCALL